MLDQNTDRMWYVIGAVIVGAALIMIMNQAMPDLFASVGETFKEKTEQTTEITDGIMPKKKVMVKPDNLETHFAKLIDYDEAENTWTLDLDANGSELFSTGFRTIAPMVKIPYGKTYTVTYEVWSPVDAVAVPDINARPIVGEYWKLHDNDDLSTRRYNGEKAVVGVDYDAYYSPFKAIPVKANTWTKMSFSYKNTAVENVDQVDIYDFSDLGIKNETGGVLRIKMRNIVAEISQ